MRMRPRRPQRVATTLLVPLLAPSATLVSAGRGVARDGERLTVEKVIGSDDLWMMLDFRLERLPPGDAGMADEPAEGT